MFWSMKARDKALFSGGFDSMLFVSEIPDNMFTEPVPVLLAGTVVGLTLVRVSSAGEVEIPHLRYVGVYKCTERRCADILAWQGK